MRAWGHQFIYDEKTLNYSFNKLGFVDISKFHICESKHDALKNLENIIRKPSEMLDLESFVIEGTKPMPSPL
jgi:hypothetical protein